jgi:NAD(P)H-quinone oxidoreductase subunit 5
VGLLLVINGLVAFSLIRVFALIFGGKLQPMTERAPEPLWAVVIPMTIVAGVTLHIPLILQQLSLLPDWATLNKDVALLLIWSSISGLSLGGVVYLGNVIPKPVRLPWKALQDVFAYDFYTPRIYRSSVVGSVDLLSRFIDWSDRYLIDGFVNLFGFVSIFGSEALKYSNSGKVQSYVFTIAICLVTIAFLTAFSFIAPSLIAIGF